MHRADLADHVEVVADEVDDHEVLGAVLRLLGEVAAQRLVLLGRRTARARALDRLGLGHAVGSDRQEALGRRAEHGHVRELEQGAERHRADPAQQRVGLQRIDADPRADRVGQADLVGLAVVDLVHALVDAVEVGVLVVARLDACERRGIGHADELGAGRAVRADMAVARELSQRARRVVEPGERVARRRRPR